MSRKHSCRVLVAAVVAVLLAGAAAPKARAGRLDEARLEAPAPAESPLVRVWHWLTSVWQETGILIDPNGNGNPVPVGTGGQAAGNAAQPAPQV